MSREDKLKELPEITEVARKLELEYVTELRGMTEKELEEKMFGLAMESETITTAKKNDEVLQAAVDHAKFLGETYREQLKMNKLRRRFISLLIEEMKK